MNAASGLVKRDVRVGPLEIRFALPLFAGKPSYTPQPDITWAESIMPSILMHLFAESITGAIQSQGNPTGEDNKASTAHR